MKTKMILSQTESAFLDFRRKEFPVVAKDNYYELLKAYKRKDKVALMKVLSIPLNDVYYIVNY